MNTTSVQTSSTASAQTSSTSSVQASSTTFVQTAWLQVADGWDSKTGNTLNQDGKLQHAAASDNTWLDVEAGQRLTFRFGGGVPATARILEARLYVEHYEEDGISPNAVSLQVGGGSLSSPTIFQNRGVPTVAQAAEAPVEWDVTPWITTGVKANDLKLVVRNGATNGKKVKIDRVFLLVRYANP